MVMTSIRSRLTRLENKRGFLDWFVMARFYDSLTDDELEAYARGGKLEPVLNRQSKMEHMNRESLVRLWKEHKRVFCGRSHEELDYYAKNGIWPEQEGRFYYSLQDGSLVVEWQTQPVDEGR